MSASRARRASAQRVDYGKEQEFSDVDLFEDSEEEAPPVKRRARKSKGTEVPSAPVEDDEDDYDNRPVYTKKNMSMTNEFEGIPYSACFVVEVRWVARKDDSDGILVDVGVSINFRKSTILKSKIRSSAIEEASAVHRNLFDYVRKACMEVGGTEGSSESDTSEFMLESTETKSAAPYPFVKIACFFVISLLLFRLSRPTPQSSSLSPDWTLLLKHVQNLEERVAGMEQSLDEILSLLKKSG